MHRVFMLALVCPIPVSFAAPDSADVANPPAAQAAPTQLVQGVVEAVLANHIDPPTRQQMILTGIKGVHKAAGVPAPAGLSRRVSALASPEQFAALIEETWPRAAVKQEATPEALTTAFVEGMLEAVPGGASLVTSKEAKVREQFQGNLYVGIHIALSLNEVEKRPEISLTLNGGPAQRAGALPRDLIERIDGKDTLGMSVIEAVDRLRGEEGTEVEIEVRQPKSKEARRLKITRGRLPQPTIQGIRERTSGGWDVWIAGPAPVGYLKIGSITGSTPHELRQMARQLESEGIRALVLDLRGVSQAAFHPTVLLADELLDGGAIGQVRTADRVTAYQAQPDSLFRGWPLAVLIDGATAGPAEWLAAALQDNRRAVLVGTPTQGVADVKTSVPVAGGDWSIEMVTRTLQRADGRAIVRPQMVPFGAMRMPPSRFPREGSDRGGVTPDHAVATKEASVRPGPIGRRPIPAKDEKSAPEPDLTRIAALRLLSEKLGSMGDEGR